MMLNAHLGPPTRSPSSAKDRPRLRLEIFFPIGLPEVDIHTRMEFVRKQGLPDSAFFGARSLYLDNSALLANCTDPNAIIQAWPLCTEIIIVSPQLALVLTSTSTESWRTHLDLTLQEDPDCAIL